MWRVQPSLGVLRTQGKHTAASARGVTAWRNASVAGGSVHTCRLLSKPVSRAASCLSRSSARMISTNVRGHIRGHTYKDCQRIDTKPQRSVASHRVFRTFRLQSISLGSPEKPTAAVESNRSTTEGAQKPESFGVRTLRRLGWLPEQLQITDPSFNRFLMVPAAVVNHLCLGAIFAWSIFNAPLTRLNGVLVESAEDWALSDVSITFSLVMGGFVWGAFLSRRLDQWGPRASCLIGSTCLATGYGLAATAVYTENLWLLWTGGAIWGLANAWSYVPPVATLLKWFPDKKGFASGSCILGFGGGAMIAAPLFTKLLGHFRTAPTFVGEREQVELINDAGRLYVDLGGDLKEVVVATLNDVKDWGLQEGVYLVGTGSTGATQTFLTCAVLYSISMAATSFIYRLPVPGYKPQTPSTAAVADGQPQPLKADIVYTRHDVAVDVATRTPQFWIMYTGFGLSIIGSYGILSAGKTMLTECFGTALPGVVTATFAASFVALMSFANLSGRLFWSNMSDYLGRRIGGDPFFGRKITYSTMWGIGPPLYVLIVWAIHKCVESPNPSVFPLIVFCGGVVGVLSSFGGSAATRPALTGDVFGTANVGVLTARQLSVVMPAAFIGPKLVNYFREKSIVDAIMDLSARVDDKIFEHAFGTGKDQLPSLIDSKTITINRLLELLPPGSVADPTPFVYDTSMYVCGGLQLLAFITNQFMKPVDPRLHVKVDESAVLEHSKGLLSGAEVASHTDVHQHAKPEEHEHRR